MAARVATHDASVLLNAGLRDTLAAKVAKTSAVPGVRALGESCPVPNVGVHVAPRLFVTDDRTFFAHAELRQEHFGPVAIVVRADAGAHGRRGEPLRRPAHGDDSTPTRPTRRGRGSCSGS